MRATLPIPGGYSECKWLYSFVPFPGLETKYFVIYRAEGHRSENPFLHQMNVAHFFLHLVRFSFYGWGNPPLPESAEAIGEYMAAVNAVDPVPQWIFDMLDQLLKVNGEEMVYNGAKLRTFFTYDESDLDLR